MTSYRVHGFFSTRVGSGQSRCGLGSPAADLAGHYHIDWQETRQLGGYELYVTEAVQLGAVTFRLVQVLSNGITFTYNHQKIYVIEQAAE